MFSSRDRMFVRASWMDFSGERHGPFPGAGVGGGNNDFARDDNAAFNVALSETHVFGSALVHEARLGVNSLQDEQAAVDRRVSESGVRAAGRRRRAVEGLARLNFGRHSPVRSAR